jgi:hypothetical protein
MQKFQERTTVDKNIGKFIGQEERQKMIAEAAYLRAKEKAFSSDPVADWLEAEKEIERKLEGQKQRTMKEEVDVFDKLHKEVNTFLGGVQETVKADTFRHALDKAVQEAKGMGKYTSESINKGAEAVKKEIARNIDNYRGARDSISGKTAGFFTEWHKKSGHFLKQAGEAAELWLSEVRGKQSPHIYHAGELTSAGTFVCSSCGHSFKQKKTGHLSRCPKCDDREFKRE